METETFAHGNPKYKEREKVLTGKKLDNHVGKSADCNIENPRKKESNQMSRIRELCGVTMWESSDS